MPRTLGTLRTPARRHPRVPHAAVPAAAVGALLLAGLLGPLAPVSAATDPAPADAARTTWAVEPADGEGPDGRVSVRHAVDPGGEVADHVVVRNFSDRAVTFDVYASDGVVTEDGQFDLLPAGTAPADGGSWVAIGDATGTLGAPGEPRRVEVPAQTDLVLPLAVTVPVDATPGDHPAGVVAAVAREDAAGVAFESRVGVRLHLRVAGELAPALAVEDVRATYAPSWNPFAPGELRLDYTLANAGNVRLGARTAATTAGPFGLAERSATGPEQREVLPGAEASGSVTVDAWPLGRLGGSVAATPVVVGDDEVEAALEQAAASYSAWALPWVQAGLVLLVVGAVLGVRGARRRAEARTRARIDAAVAAAAGPAS